MDAKGKENASDVVPTGCTAVLLISYLDSLLPELEQEKPRIKHYSKEKLMKMLAQANEKDKMEKRKKDKKEKCKQKMYDNPKHKESEQDIVAQMPSLKYLLKPFLENVPDILRDEINTAVENHQTRINTAVENPQTKMFQEMNSLQSEAVAEIKKIVGNCNKMSAMYGRRYARRQKNVRTEQAGGSHVG